MDFILKEEQLLDVEDEEDLNELEEGESMEDFDTSPTNLDLDRQLIGLVKANPFIFDRSHELHSHRLMREKFYETAASMMSTETKQITAKDLEKRWLSMRCQFNRQFKKIKQKRLAPTPSGKIPKVWPLYSVLEFLSEHIEHRGIYGYGRSKTSANNNSQQSPSPANSGSIYQLQYFQPESSPHSSAASSHQSVGLAGQDFAGDVYASPPSDASHLRSSAETTARSSISSFLSQPCGSSQPQASSYISIPPAQQSYVARGNTPKTVGIEIISAANTAGPSTSRVEMASTSTVRTEKPKVEAATEVEAFANWVAKSLETLPAQLRYQTKRQIFKIVQDAEAKMLFG